MKNLLHAIREWKEILGAKRTITSSSLLKLASTATFKSSQQVMVLLQPKNVEEVSAIMKIANKRRVPVYPVSRGKNWGMGSSVPQRSGVVIDLSRMKKIADFNEKMGYITVQPGVTFKLVEDFLVKKNSGLMLDSIGSTPDASIIGNTAERGHGMAMYADRFNFVCGMEIVLPSGKIIETGFESIQHSALGPLGKWGLGPYLDGLFTQSNMGIITRLTLWLKPKAEYFQSFIFHMDSEEQLSHIMETWRQISLQGLQASLRIFNDIRMIAFRQRLPESMARPLSQADRRQLRSNLKIGKWIGLGGIYSMTEKHAEADRLLLQDRMGNLVDKLEFFSQREVDKHYADANDETKVQLDFLFNKSLLRGFTSRAGINMVYWRKPSTIPIQDLHKDGCGVLWYCLAIPLTGSAAQSTIKICERISRKYGFELNIGFLFISQRTLDITGALCYDRNVKGEDARAIQCHDEIMEAMIQKGYSPYRLGIQSMKYMRTQKGETRKFLKAVKQAIDPHGVLAPGHYVDS